MRPIKHHTTNPARFFVTQALLLLCWLGAAGAWAEEECAAWIDRAREISDMRDADAAAGVAAGESALERIRETAPHCLTGQAMLLSAIGSNLHILGRNEEAVARFEEGLAVAGDDPRPVVTATLHRGRGVALVDLGVLDRALESYLTSLSASEAMGDDLESGRTAGNIGNLYNMLGALEESRAYHQRALVSFEAAGWQTGIAGTLINLGSLARRRAGNARAAGDEELARAEFTRFRDDNLRALEIFTELGNRRGIAYASNNVGTALDELGRAAEGLPYHETSLRLRQEIGDRIGQIQSQITLASSMITMARFDAAEQLLLEAHEMVPSGNLLLLIDVLNRWVALEEARGDYAAALAWQKEVTARRLEFSDEEERARVDELRAMFGAGQRERDIQLLRSQAEVSELRNQRQRLLAWTGLVVALLLALMIVALYGRYRTKARLALELRRVAGTDPLTGLANRRSMLEAMQQAAHEAESTGRPLSLIMADIDDFKPINDRFGHAVGDRLLADLGRFFMSRLRTRDTVARWGGEEFLLLLPDTDAHGAHVLAEQLRQDLTREAFAAADETITLRLTFGVVVFEPGMTLDTLIDLADRTMYQGKALGKNRTLVYGGRATVSRKSQ